MLGVPFKVERVGKVTVVRITEKRLLQERELNQVKSALERLARDPRPTQLLVDFAAVQALTSGMLSVLLTVRKDLRERGGRLALCGLRPEVHEVFAMTGLADTLNVYPTQEEALLSYRGQRAGAAAPGKA